MASALSDTDLDVGVHVHEGPLAVLAVDAEGYLHLLVEQDADLDALFLQGKVQTGAVLNLGEEQWKWLINIKHPHFLLLKS